MGDSHERIEQSDGKIEFFTNNTEQVTLSGSNLGIGTTSPAVKLEVNGGASVAAFFKSSSNTVPVSLFTTNQTISTIGFKV